MIREYQDSHGDVLEVDYAAAIHGHIFFGTRKPNGDHALPVLLNIQQLKDLIEDLHAFVVEHEGA